jgi:hypothetical protein
MRSQKLKGPFCISQLHEGTGESNQPKVTPPTQRKIAQNRILFSSALQSLTCSNQLRAINSWPCGSG